MKIPIIGTALPRQNPFQRANKEATTFCVAASLFFYDKGFEQGAIKNSPVDCFCDAATSVSEAIIIMYYRNGCQTVISMPNVPFGGKFRIKFAT